MPKRILFLTVLLSLSLLAAAAPAGRRHIVLRQPDGQEVNAILRGDEFHKLLTTEEGCAIALGEDGYYHYIYYTPEGYREQTPWRVNDPATPPSVLAASRVIPHEAMARLAAKRRRIASDLRARSLGVSVPRAQFPAERRILVILAQFSDLKFRYSREDFDQLLNTRAKQYFEDQFASVGTQFSFDVTSIVMLPNRYSYYGKNDTEGNDTNPHLMIRDACQLADPEVDFSLYDDDADGTVDNVFVVYAGADESEGAGDDHIWSHQWYLRDGAGITLTLDGMLINKYATTSELMYTARGTTKLTGIGTFCHEYSHTFGLPDFYDTDYEGSGGISEGLWGSLSLMDNGNRNDGSMTPPYYNAVERWLLGLSVPRPLTEGEQRLSPVHKEGDCLIMQTDKAGEYYIFECRAQENWDAFIGGEGLLIYHIDRSDNTAGDKTAAARWKDNTLNCAPVHPCVDLVEADPAVVSRFASARASGTLRDLIPRVFFPQEERVSFTPNTQPSFVFWSGTGSGLSLTDIRMDGQDILFSVTGSETMRVPEIASISGDVFQDAAIISWTSDIDEYYGSSWLIWGPAGKEQQELEVRPWSPGHYSVTLEGLDPKKAYTAKACFKSGGSPVNGRNFNFTTKSVNAGSRPFIWLPSEGRNADGSFSAGAKLPLRIYHLPAGVSVSWRFDGAEVMPGTDGYFTPGHSGTLKAILVAPDGSEDIILKTITVR